MSYKKPLRKKGAREPKEKHIVKLCYFEFKIQDIHNEHSRKYFIEHFKEINEKVAILKKIEAKYDLDISCMYNQEGELIPPIYEDYHKHNYFTKYEWNEQYKTFKIDYIQEIEGSELEKYLLQQAKWNQADALIMEDGIKKHKRLIREELEEFKDNTYKINKNNETITEADTRWRRRVGLDKETKEDSEKEGETERIEPVDLLSDDFMKRELDYLDEVWGVTRK